MTNNYILVGTERQAQLEAAKAAFFTSGGQVTELGSYRFAPAPPRADKIDPETVLVRKRRKPSAADRAALRRMAESL